MEGARPVERLHEEVRRWIWSRGWKSLRPIQEQAIEPILAGERDLVIAAATAGGKTEAAFLPIVSRVLAEPASGLRALYVSPLKALINDQHRRLEELCKGAGVPVHRWHGDVEAGRKREVLERPSGILAITPESLEALFVLRGSRIRALFEGLGHVVIDELHSFLESERGMQLRSLLHRLELALRRRVPRVGLSATIGDRALAAAFLRPEDPERVLWIQPPGGERELLLQVRAYVDARGASEDADGDSSARVAIAEHLFRVLRGTTNLVFANSRREVELYADLLRRTCEERRVPNEFHPHHGSLSKELRETLEARLQGGELPVSALCTSTLEMGIDVGDVESVAQIGVPSSVAALRQRLGRSGRRGKPSVLRVYVCESELDEASGPGDRLRTGLVQAIAACRLLLRGWCEPPVAGALHLSTLLHQVLSLVAQHSGLRADEGFDALCARGPFRAVDASTFASLLRSMGSHDLLQQSADGTLVAGLAGERLVDHYSFYSVFATAEEHRLVHRGNVLGSLPIDFALVPGTQLVFAGRRWRVLSIDSASRTIDVEPGAAGRLPRFSGGAAHVHDELRAEMRRAYEGSEGHAFLDARARLLLEEARAEYAALGLARRRIVAFGRDALLFPWRGERVMNTLAVLLRSLGADADQEGALIRLRGADEDSARALLERARAAAPLDALGLARSVANKASAKFDTYLTEELLSLDYASHCLDIAGAMTSLDELLVSA